MLYTFYLFIHSTSYVSLTLSFQIRVQSNYLHHINGWLGDYDLDYNLLLVNVQTPPLPVARLDHQVQLASCSKVLAVGRLYRSKKLMATSGLVKDMTRIFDHEEIAVSTCKISKVHFLYLYMMVTDSCIGV